jgi:RNA polymerase sigma-70 factor, ECF subfamily
MEANAIVRGTRTMGAVLGRWFRAQPLVEDSAFQPDREAYPGHWRRFPHPWRATSTLTSTPATRSTVLAALEELPGTWRTVLLRHDSADAEKGDGVVAADIDSSVAAELGLTVEQERDILARARAALRDKLDGALRKAGPR